MNYEDFRALIDFKSLSTFSQKAAGSIQRFATMKMSDESSKNHKRVESN